MTDRFSASFRAVGLPQNLVGGRGVGLQTQGSEQRHDSVRASSANRTWRQDPALRSHDRSRRVSSGQHGRASRLSVTSHPPRWRHRCRR